jgi:hypothetical protein
MTSVALIRAAAVCPGLSCISRSDVAVIIDAQRGPVSFGITLSVVVKEPQRLQDSDQKPVICAGEVKLR